MKVKIMDKIGQIYKEHNAKEFKRFVNMSNEERFAYLQLIESLNEYIN